MFNIQNLESLFTVIKRNLDLPIELQSENYDISSEQTISLEKTTDYKLKKWCSYVILKLLRLSQRKKCLFWQFFEDIYSLNYLKSVINLLIKRKTVIITPKIFLTLLKYLRFSFKSKNKSLITDYNEALLFEILIPSLYITKSDEDLWNDDPQEYIRRQEDDSFLFNKIKTTILQIIQIICENNNFSSNQSYLQLLLKFTFQSFQDKTLQPTTKCLLKEALLNILGFLKEIITDDNVIYAKIEELLKLYVFQEFSSPIGFLRAKTCWIFEKYDFLNFNDKSLVNAVIENITNCLMDTQLPVQYMACVNLNEFIDNEEVQQKLKPILPQILELILKIMDNIDSEEIVYSLESIIESFHDEITPFALELLKHLKNAFFKYNYQENQKISYFSLEEEESDVNINSGTIKNKRKDIKGEEESEMAAFRCLEAIKIILSTSLNEHIYQKSSLFLIDLLNYCLKQEGSDYLKQGLEILALIVAGMTKISNEILFYFPILIYLCIGIPNLHEISLEINNELSPEYKELLVDSAKGWAGIEYLESIMSCLSSYIGKIKENIFINRDLFNNLFIGLISQLIDKKDIGDVDTFDNLMLLHINILILENCSNLSKEFIEYLVDRYMKEIRSEKSKCIKLKAMETVK